MGRDKASGGSVPMIGKIPGLAIFILQTLCLVATTLATQRD